MPTNNLQYSPVSGIDEDNDEAKLLYNNEILATHKSRHLARLWPWFTHGALLIVNVLFLTLWIQAPTGKSLTIYSPANEAIEYGEIIRFNGSLGAPSIYRGEPSPELEAALLSGLEGFFLIGYASQQ
ncbi:hypothetical protein BJ138DRAFT_1117939 [Hygrophoropsis aurantiaca]|uniref:Uncharacterized protein n=1 Tax=Hygrophoropsis aurantiaca TaxID=72124 RepID=A0ACB7ZY87_9AGAM|nr:hypothetical protein BJ138DRAFT_1117939 [Hygrophoropsis aurantiaca]